MSVPLTISFPFTYSIPSIKSQRREGRISKIIIFIPFIPPPNKGLGHFLMGNFRKVLISFYGKYKKLLKKSLHFSFLVNVLKIVCKPIRHQLLFPNKTSKKSTLRIYSNVVTNYLAPQPKCHKIQQDTNT